MTVKNRWAAMYVGNTRQNRLLTLFLIIMLDERRGGVLLRYFVKKTISTPPVIPVRGTNATNVRFAVGNLRGVSNASVTDPYHSFSNRWGSSRGTSATGENTLQWLDMLLHTQARTIADLNTADAAVASTVTATDITAFAATESAT